MKKHITLLVALFATIFSVLGQSVYKNGYLSTGTVSKSGVTVPAGFTWSEVQNDVGVTTISNTSAGSSGHYISAASAFSLADNFTVPAGQAWAVTGIGVYGYQTGATSVPIDQLYFKIWNGPPDVGTSTVVFGDLTTNRLGSSIDSLIYRLFNSLYPSPGSAPGTTRKVWRFGGTGSVTLQPGTYWLEWQVHAINNGTVFFPTSTVVGTRGLTGWNAKQFSAATGLWVAAVDDGNPAASADIPQDFPFEINYVSSVVPVKLLSFTGMQTSNGNQISWKTTSEIDFSGFETERSTDGTSFNKLSFVHAKGGNNDNEYIVVDAKVSSNTTYYYRLKQIDKNGSFVYSKIIVLKTPALSDEIWVNAFTQRPLITIRAEKDAVATLRIVNNNGQMITQQNFPIKKGISTTQLSAVIRQKGVYYATLVYATGKTINKRFVAD